MSGETAQAYTQVLELIITPSVPICLPLLGKRVFMGRMMGNIIGIDFSN